ncbi:acyl-coenzyme A synthetase/AMP-(fatty) acid ligase [Salirhabdus euzebyi]|uniref:Acyl-coenzyme A synthetase/AMP-(Fatty) acid ligase n=1 Tax=Salirhabdus euzebyi TaxID=394506 RepID=A0A841Q819_9BACI|nr:fatty acid--CoA ligase family protein [Salirhabdus euzebyi]MBB6454548.1 acyl-coenzyme A synthetase/AMP-(fatty) acid ligase [Salirhabdus euzebyi]
MNKIFLVYKQMEVTYENLINDINAKETYQHYIFVNDNNPYSIFLSIIHSLLYKYPIEILDGDFSDIELEEIGVNKTALSDSKSIERLLTINDFNVLLDKISENEDWSLSLYTSGTTGRPKKVTHTFQSLTRNVKTGDKFSDNIWAFAYNPTHIAGLQVFFQSLMNQNTIVYAFNDQLTNLSNLIEEYNITNISATSTYYRNVLPYLKDREYDSIKRITFGGEKYDPSIEDKLKTIFPNVKIRNIYASTEAGSLFVAKGEKFIVPHTIKGLVKINENNELLIHQSLLGKSNSFTFEGNWFNTGDLVEFIDNIHFKFISRNSDMINVGGYKVNPLEVENTLINVEGVIDLVVKSKKNKVTGEILVADVVKGDNYNDMELKKSIKQYGAKHLQEWKIPRIIKFVNEIPKSRTGKKVRK